MLDIIFDKPLKDSREAIWQAGLGWNVSKEPVYLADGTLVENTYANVRSDTQVQLGIVKGRYAILQNSEAFYFAYALEPEVLPTPNRYLQAEVEGHVINPYPYLVEWYR